VLGPSFGSIRRELAQIAKSLVFSRTPWIRNEYVFTMFGRWFAVGFVDTLQAMRLAVGRGWAAVPDLIVYFVNSTYELMYVAAAAAPAMQAAVTPANSSALRMYSSF
jgi:hypothetical protein